MKTLPVFFCALLVAVSAPAQGVYNMAKQQAKDATASENRNQQAIDSFGRAAPAPPPQNNPPPNPALQATMQNIAALRADFESLEASPTNAPPLDNDLTVAAQGAKPSAATVARLAQDLTAAVGGNKNLSAQNQRLAQFVHAIFNSSHLSATQQETVCDTAQKILTGGGVSDYSAAEVIKDLKKIAVTTS